MWTLIHIAVIHEKYGSNLEDENYLILVYN